MAGTPDTGGDWSGIGGAGGDPSFGGVGGEALGGTPGAVGGEAGAGGAHGPVECSPAPPLRVDPDAAAGGTGETWASPVNDLQAALDRQAAAGGGEVWVKGGEFSALTTATGDLITMPSCVALRGGFAGFEGAPDERPEGTPDTWLQAAEGVTTGVLLRLEGLNDASVERVTLRTTRLAFDIRDSENVLFRKVTVERSSSVDGPPEIVDSSARFERFTIDRGTWITLLQITGSEFALVDSTVTSLEFGGVYAYSSRVLLDRSTLGAGLYLDEASDGLLIRSNVSGGLGRGPAVVASNRLTLVNSRLTAGGAGSAPIEGGSFFVFNSTFTGLRSGPAGGGRPTAAVFSVDELEVAFSTFYDNTCDALSDPCWADVETGESVFVTNSIFVHQDPVLANAPSDPRYFATSTGELGPGTCTILGEVPYVFGDDLALALDHPCRDAGDVVAAETARFRLLQLAAPYLEEPFEADLSRYESPDWWRSESAAVAACFDAGEPDPGSHAQFSCEDDETTEGEDE